MKAKPWGTSTRRLRLPQNWPKIRAYILDRDGRICSAGCQQAAQTQSNKAATIAAHKIEPPADVHAGMVVTHPRLQGSRRSS
jgi:hypothetical protein